MSYQGALSTLLGNRVRRCGGFQLPVVSLVRDPIARQISGLFQSPDLASISLHDRSGRFDVDRVVAYLEEHFLTADPHHGADSWFDEELGTVFGVDVFGSLALATLPAIWLSANLWMWRRSPAER